MTPEGLAPEIVRRTRKAPPPPSSAPGSWLVTFADMVTLLLTFLVLLIGITTLDPRTTYLLSEGVLADEPEYVRSSDGVLLYSDQGLLAPVVELVDNLDFLPENVMFDQREIKNAIFQLDPAKVSDFEQIQEAADEGVTIFKDNRGLVVQWDRSLLFPEGEAALFDENKLLLEKLAIFLNNIGLPISVEGHTDPLSALEGGTGPAAYELSLSRAKAVMEYLVSLGVQEKRFRIGGHGGARPRATDPEESWENSRLEIVIYQPARSSLIGN